MHRILRYAALGPVKSFCHHRLMLLEQKFNLHVMLNADKEFLSQKAAPHRDFYNVRKVGEEILVAVTMVQPDPTCPFSP
jgi:AMP deaminase